MTLKNIKMKTPEQIFDETHGLFYKALQYGETNHKELAVIMMGEYGRLVEEEQIEICKERITDVDLPEPLDKLIKVYLDKCKRVIK